jgi:fucose 4-O-acetylase-like acetyltransferase
MNAKGGQRHHHVDAIRVSAILLLIPYHAARYVQKGFGGSRVADSAVWFVHSWHMPLFFAVSGFVAAGALQRSGAARQIRAKLTRLGIPLAVGMLTVVPLANFAVIEAAALRPRSQALPAGRELTVGNLFNLTPRHLWFLAYLLLISLLAIGVWAVLQRAPSLRSNTKRFYRTVMESPLAIPLLATTSAAILFTKSGWAAGGSAAASLVPVPTLLAYYVLFFVFGFLLGGQPDLIERMKRGAAIRLGLGVACAPLAFLLFYDSADFTGNVGVDGALVSDGGLRFLGLLCVGLVCWLVLFGTWGMLARYVRSSSRALRYLSDASFWIYLIHIPFLVALQSALAETGLGVAPRWLLTVTGTLALSFGSYALIVRRSAIGRFLHGPRRRAGKESDSAPGLRRQHPSPQSI